MVKQASDDNAHRYWLQRQIVFILTQAGVKNGEEHAQALAWAFGPDWMDVPIFQWPDRWNKLHPRATQAKPSDSFTEFVFMVGFYFKQQKEKAKIQEARRKGIKVETEDDA